MASTMTECRARIPSIVRLKRKVRYDVRLLVRRDRLAGGSGHWKRNLFRSQEGRSSLRRSTPRLGIYWIRPFTLHRIPLVRVQTSLHGVSHTLDPRVYHYCLRFLSLHSPHLWAIGTHQVQEIGLWTDPWTGIEGQFPPGSPRCLACNRWFVKRPKGWD